MSVKVGIWGSCVTRDIFRIVNGNYQFCYFSRSSIISGVSKPIVVNEDNIKLDSAFDKRMVLNDFKKNFFETLSNFNPDVLIIDLIDERFDVVKIGDSYITKSSEFIKSGLEASYTYNGTFKWMEDQKQIPWKNACKAFIEKLIEVVPSEKIILHECFWATEYLNSDGKLVSFKETSTINNMNNMLKSYYELFKLLIPNLKILSNNGIADETHKWTLRPYHYTDDYYVEISEQINRHMTNK